MDAAHEAEVVRLYVSTYWRNLLGDRASESTRLRVLDAVARLEEAAKTKEVA